MFGTGSPFGIASNAKPAFFLQEIEKHDLTEQFFGEINRVHALDLEIGSVNLALRFFSSSLVIKVKSVWVMY